jgi:multimeric flavodoxin WrbA
MKITVLSGSPKGDNSITLQYIKYLIGKTGNINYTIFNISHKIKIIEKNETYFNEILEEIKNSDAVLWVFPIYYHFIPSQLLRFIEMVIEMGKENVFYNKYSTSFSTSIPYFDYTAHDYIQYISELFKMNYVKGISASLHYDINNKEKRKIILDNFSFFIDCFDKNIIFEKRFDLKSDKIKQLNFAGQNLTEIKTDKNILLITDSTDEKTNLGKMINVYKKIFNSSISVVNLNEIKINNGCLGCLHCFYDGVCIQKDDINSLHRNRIKNADALIFAGTIKNGFLSSKWKSFWDRWMQNGASPILKGVQVKFLISGNLKNSNILRDVLTAYMENMGANLIGFITDEEPDLTEKLIYDMAKSLNIALEHDFERLPTYISVGGHKVERDMIYRIRFAHYIDHLYYKKNKIYDFPQNNLGERFLNNFLLFFINTFPSFKKYMQKSIVKLMLSQIKIKD